MTIDGKFCLLYFGLPFGFFCCSSTCASASVVWLHEMKQSLDRNPLVEGASRPSSCFSGSVAWLAEEYWRKDRKPM